MKKVIALFAVVIMIAGLSSSVFAQTNVTEATSSAAKIAAALTITDGGTLLHFGTIASGSALGACILASADATRTSTGGITLLAQGSNASNPIYAVTGNPNSSFNVTLPGSMVVSSGTSPNMTINALTTSGLSGTTGTLDVNGVASFRLGGTLNVAALQPGGDYTGTFNVTVAYN